MGPEPRLGGSPVVRVSLRRLNEEASVVLVESGGQYLYCSHVRGDARSGARGRASLRAILGLRRSHGP